MIPMHKVFMPDNIDEVMEPLRKVIESGWIGEGPKVLEFEKHISDYIGNAYVTALNSCTSALQLALRLCGVGIGDEVISTPMTCMATNEPIVLTGATPVWADVDANTGNIGPESIRQKIGVRTKSFWRCIGVATHATWMKLIKLLVSMVLKSSKIARMPGERFTGTKRSATIRISAVSPCRRSNILPPEMGVF